LIDAAKISKTAGQKPLESGPYQESLVLEDLHPGEGYLIFSVDTALPVSQRHASILSSGGEDNHLSSLVRFETQDLSVFLQACDEDASMLRWNESHHSWSKVGSYLAFNQMQHKGELVALGQCLDRGKLKYGILMSIHDAHVDASRFATLQRAGLSILSKLSTEEKMDDTAQKRSILTAGERRVLLWCGNGKTSFEISRILGLSEHTVNHYIASAVRKLDATNRTHAIAKAIKMNIVNVADIK